MQPYRKDTVCLHQRQSDVRLPQAHADAMYSAYAIYSPDVPVFRDDEGTLLDKPFLCSFITLPAPNANVVLERDRRLR